MLPHKVDTATNVLIDESIFDNYSKGLFRNLKKLNT